MVNPKVNYVIDVLLLISFLLMGVTGLIKYYGLFGFKWNDLATLHDISGIVFFVLIVVHIILHYKWIINMTKSFFKK